MAYVFCDGIHINELMVKSGYGIIAYISRPNTTILSEMKEAENEAKESKVGVWSIKGFVDEKNQHYNRKDAADRKSTRLNSSHRHTSRMPSSA